jgi:hypothetical protein
VISEDQDPIDPLMGGPAVEEPADEKSRSFVPEFVRKVAVAGLGALFMTEEGIRNLSSQLKLPKEVLGFIVGQAEKTKDEVGRVISEEIRRFFQSEKLRDEFLKLLSGMTIEVKAEVRLLPDRKKTAKEDDGEYDPKVVISELHARRSKRRKE